MPDLDAIRQHEVNSRNRILSLLLNNPTMLNTLRELLVPADTSAFPPSVLSVPVRSGPNYRETTLRGYYSTDSNNITLSPTSRTTKLPTKYEPYKVLLHEAGHARGYSQFKHLNIERDLDTIRKDRKNTLPIEVLHRATAHIRALNEESANAVADSLVPDSLIEYIPTGQYKKPSR